MRVLVTVASKHGATREIGEELAHALRSRGLEVAVRAPQEVATIDDFDAVVLGSAVYAGHWLRPATELAAREGDELRRRPVWLLSSGPLGDEPAAFADPPEVADITLRIGARGHRVFGGELSRGELGLAERAVVKMVRAPYGDFRNWLAIDAWADELAGDLQLAAV